MFRHRCGAYVLVAGGVALLARDSSLLSSPKRRRPEAPLAILTLFALLLGVTVLYLPTLDDPFHGDDFVAFMDFRTKGFWEYSRDVFLFDDSNFYWRPVGDIFHRALFEAFGLDVVAFRVAALGFFLLTLAGLYAFCVREGLGRFVALGAVLVMGIGPDHALSVSWVTNTSRLMAGCFFVLALLLIQHGARRRRGWAWEAAAFLAMTVAALCDEVTVALAPVLFVYGTLVARRDFRPWSAVARLLAYAALPAVIVPLQFTYTIDDEQRLTHYGFGTHMVESAWTLASQLTLPIASGSPVEEGIHLIPSIEWAAGPALIVACALIFLLGSRTSRFLVVWLGCALAPFALWEAEYLSSRYVYLAAMPFAILLSWLVVQVAAWLTEIGAPIPGWRLASTVAVAAAGIVLVAYGSSVALQATKERNASWSRETAKYGALRSALEQSFDSLSPGTRLFVVHGQGTDFWSSAVARSLYGQPDVWVFNIPWQRMDQAPLTSNGNNLLLYLLNDRFLVSSNQR